MTRRYLGSWTLPSGNSVDVYLDPNHRLECRWDRQPSSAWSAEDVEHWREVTFPEILRAVVMPLSALELVETFHQFSAAGRASRRRSACSE